MKNSLNYDVEKMSGQRRSIFSQLMMVIALLYLAAHPGLAVDYEWLPDTAINPAWSNPDNWYPHGVPGKNDTATFGVSGQDVSVIGEGMVEIENIIFSESLTRDYEIQGDGLKVFEGISVSVFDGVTASISVNTLLRRNEDNTDWAVTPVSDESGWDEDEGGLKVNILEPIAHLWTFNGMALDGVDYADGEIDEGLGDQGETNVWISLDDAELEDAFSAATISVRFWADTVTGIQSLYEEGGVTHGIALRLNGSNLEGAVRNSGTQTTVTLSGVATSQWHVATLVYDGPNETLSLYLDGDDNPDVATTAPTSIPSHENPAGIGAVNEDSVFGVNGTSGTSTNYFDGAMDEVRLYKEALSADSIAVLYQSYVDPSPEWLFNGSADAFGWESDVDGTLKGEADASYTVDSVEGGSCLSVDGVNDWVSIDHADLQDAFTTYTISLWFKAGDLSGQQELYDEGGKTQGIALRLNGSKLEGAVVQGGSLSKTSVSGVSQGVWHLATLVFNGPENSLTVYLDGDSSSTITSGVPSGITGHSNSAGIGAVNNQDAFGTSQTGGSVFFNGLIDDVRIYAEQALPALVVKQQYQAVMNSSDLAVTHRWSSGDWSEKNLRGSCWRGGSDLWEYSWAYGSRRCRGRSIRQNGVLNRMFLYRRRFK